jgi:predicted TIM-barrel fold metal-dependent hydrolase
VQGTVIESRVAALLDEGRPIMEFAEAHRVPIVVHTSYIASDTWSQVRDCLAVAEAFPKARFNLAHSLRMSASYLEEAAEIPNVWVDCAAHLNHCRLALDNHPAVASGGDRVDADFTKPTEVLQAVHNLVPGKYLWGSDNPFQSWCDDDMKFVHTYKAEADALHALPPTIKKSIGTTAPEAWLFGKT